MNRLCLLILGLIAVSAYGIGEEADINSGVSTAEEIEAETVVEPEIITAAETTTTITTAVKPPSEAFLKKKAQAKALLKEVTEGVGALKKANQEKAELLEVTHQVDEKAIEEVVEGLEAQGSPKMEALIDKLMTAKEKLSKLQAQERKLEEKLSDVQEAQSEIVLKEVKAELKQPKAEASKEAKLDKDASLLRAEEKLGTQAEGKVHSEIQPEQSGKDIHPGKFVQVNPSENVQQLGGAEQPVEVIQPQISSTQQISGQQGEKILGVGETKLGEEKSGAGERISEVLQPANAQPENKPMDGANPVAVAGGQPVQGNSQLGNAPEGPGEKVEGNIPENKAGEGEAQKDDKVPNVENKEDEKKDENAPEKDGEGEETRKKKLALEEKKLIQEAQELYEEGLEAERNNDLKRAINKYYKAINIIPHIPYKLALQSLYRLANPKSPVSTVAQKHLKALIELYPELDKIVQTFPKAVQKERSKSQSKNSYGDLGNLFGDMKGAKTSVSRGGKSKGKLSNRPKSRGASFSRGRSFSFGGLNSAPSMRGASLRSSIRSSTLKTTQRPASSGFSSKKSMERKKQTKKPSLNTSPLLERLSLEAPKTLALKQKIERPEKEDIRSYVISLNDQEVKKALHPSFWMAAHQTSQREAPKWMEQLGWTAYFLGQLGDSPYKLSFRAAVKGEPAAQALLPLFIP